MALLSQGLLPASFRGAPFAVVADTLSGGRRQAAHVYPGRDTPWMEDMGRAPRSFSFRGFITTGDVVFQNGPIQLQRVLLLAALEKKGSGVLTHPTLGILNVSVTSFSVGQDLGAGRMSSVDITFVESGKRSFPSLLVSGSALLSALAGIASVALDLVTIGKAISVAIGGKDAAAQTSATYAASVVSAGADATSLLNLAAQLPGNNGRYSAGANAGVSSSNASPYATHTSIDDLVADASAQRAALGEAAVAVGNAAEALGSDASYSDLAKCISALIDALVAACANPGDAVRLLVELINNPPVDVSATSTGGVPLVQAFQRSACFALARACASYQPSSYDDAAAVLSTVAGLIDSVAIEAADAGDDNSFEALNALLVAVTDDLRARGGELAPMKSFTTAVPLPDVVIAQRLYRDPSRADELLGEIDPIHPLFMPTSFQALAA